MFPHMTVLFIKIPSSLVSLVTVRLPICFKTDAPRVRQHTVVLGSPRSSPRDENSSSFFWGWFWEHWCGCAEDTGKTRTPRKVALDRVTLSNNPGSSPLGNSGMKWHIYFRIIPSEGQGS